jgi:arabinose-5-phosphate isomerase
VALLKLKGFRREDFAAFHPGGSLGRKLSLRVHDVMVADVRPLLPSATMREAVMVLAAQRGLAVMADGHALRGVITTGDLARLAQKSPDFLEIPVAQVMTASPKTAHPDELGGACVGRMEQHGIIAMPVVSDGKLVGVVHLHDLLRAGAV